MKLSRIDNAKKNMMYGILYRLVNTVFPFLNRTFLLYLLGAEYLGLNSLFYSVLSVLNLAELGFGPAITYSMYKPIAEDDEQTICGLINFYKYIYRCIGCLILVVGVIVSFFLDRIIRDTLPDQVNIRALFFIQLSNVVISYLCFAYRSSIFAAYQREDVLSKISSVVMIMQYLSQFVALFITKNYYIYLLLMPISTLASNCIKAIIAKKMFPRYMKNNKQTLSDMVKKNIMIKVKALFIHKVGGVIANSFDNIVISAFLGLTTIAIFNNYGYIYSSLCNFLAIFYTSIQAGLGNSIALETPQANFEKYKKLTVVNIWMVGWCSVCLLCLYQPFMQIWVGDRYLFHMDTVVLFVIYFYINMSRRIVITFKDAAGMWTGDKFKPLVSGVVNLILNIIFVQKWAINGVLLSTIMSFALIEIPWETTVLYRGYFKKDMISFFKEQGGYIAFFGAISCITFCICSMVGKNGIIGFIIKCIICVVIPNMIVILMWNKRLRFIRGYLTARRTI